MTQKKRGRPPGAPRIRTIKPEMPEDERVGGRLSVTAELLFVRLISMADDEGRFQASSSRVVGFAFPHREMAPAKVRRLLKEIEAQGLILLYSHDQMPYGVVVNFRKHQQINKPTPSSLPACPDGEVTRANAIPPDELPGSLPEYSRSNTGARREYSQPSPRVGAAVPDPVPLPSAVSAPKKEKRGSGGRAAGVVDQLVPPQELPTEIADRLDPVLAILAGIQAERGGGVPTPRGIGLALVAFPRRDHLAVARELQHWALAGRGQSKPVKDWVATYRTFLGNSEDADPVRAFAGRLRGVDPVDDKLEALRRRAAGGDVIEGTEAA